eukprot:COSAG04_NODE_4846_length_1864_cov_2.002833_3_plen_192_part_00
MLRQKCCSVTITRTQFSNNRAVGVDVQHGAHNSWPVLWADTNDILVWRDLWQYGNVSCPPPGKPCRSEGLPDLGYMTWRCCFGGKNSTIQSLSTTLPSDVREQRFLDFCRAAYLDKLIAISAGVRRRPYRIGHNPLQERPEMPKGHQGNAARQFVPHVQLIGDSENRRGVLRRKRELLEPAGARARIRGGG